MILSSARLAVTCSHRPCTRPYTHPNLVIFPVSQYHLYVLIRVNICTRGIRYMPQYLRRCRMQGFRRHLGLQPPSMSISYPSQAQTLPSEARQYFRNRNCDHKSDILHSFSCDMSFLSFHCPHWPLLQSCHILCDYFNKWWVVWCDHSRMSWMQVALELPSAITICSDETRTLVGTVRNLRGMVEQDVQS